MKSELWMIIRSENLFGGAYDSTTGIHFPSHNTPFKRERIFFVQADSARDAVDKYTNLVHHKEITQLNLEREQIEQDQQGEENKEQRDILLDELSTRSFKRDEERGREIESVHRVGESIEDVEFMWTATNSMTGAQTRSPMASMGHIAF